MTKEEQVRAIQERRTKSLESFRRLGKALLESKLSVFLELEISHEDKKAILKELNYSTNILYK